MADRIQIRVYGSEDKAKTAQQELKLKGYAADIETASAAVLNGLDLGGHLDNLQDIDGQIFVVIGRK